MDQTEAIAAFAALAHDTRLSLFKRLVCAGPAGLAAGALAAGAKGATVSHHLAALAGAGLVEARNAGRSVVYSARTAGVCDLLTYIAKDCCEGRPEYCGLDFTVPAAAAPSEALAEGQPSAEPAANAAPLPAADPAYTIYHNPACGTSRNVLAMIRASGVEPVIVEYLTDPPDRATLEAIVAAIDPDANPRALLRRKGTPYDALDLGYEWLTSDALFEAMAAHPVLIERPVVVTPKGTALCRPSERVLALLDAPLPSGFVKEDGTAVTA